MTTIVFQIHTDSHNKQTRKSSVAGPQPIVHQHRHTRQSMHTHSLDRIAASNPRIQSDTLLYICRLEEIVRRDKRIRLSSVLRTLEVHPAQHKKPDSWWWHIGMSFRQDTRPLYVHRWPSGCFLSVVCQRCSQWSWHTYCCRYFLTVSYPTSYQEYYR